MKTNEAGKFNRYFVLGDCDDRYGPFDNLKAAQDCAGTIGLVVVPLHEVSEQRKIDVA